MLQLFPGDKQIQRVRYSEEVKRPTLVRALIPIRFLDVDSLLRHFASCSCSCHSFLLLSAVLSHTCFLWPGTPTTRQHQLFLPLSARSARSILRREDDFIRPDPRERTLRRLRHIASHAADWIEPLHNAMISPHRQLARPFDPDTSLSILLCFSPLRCRYR